MATNFVKETIMKMPPAVRKVYLESNPGLSEIIDVKKPGIKPKKKNIKDEVTYTKKQDLTTLDSSKYAISGLFGLPGVIGQIAQLGSAGTPEKTTTTIKGTPESIEKLKPFTTSKTNGGNGFKGALEGLGTGIQLAGYLVPIGLGLMLLTQIKGLFK